MKPLLDILGAAQNDYKPILNKRTILLITRDEAAMELFGNDLQVRGYYCLVAKGEHDTMETLRLINASVIIMDTDGLTADTVMTTASAIRSLHSSARILVMTSLQNHQFTSAADAVLMRPFKIQQLYDTLSLILT